VIVSATLNVNFIGQYINSGTIFLSELPQHFIELKKKKGYLFPNAKNGSTNIAPTYEILRAPKRANAPITQIPIPNPTRVVSVETNDVINSVPSPSLPMSSCGSDSFMGTDITSSSCSTVAESPQIASEPLITTKPKAATIPSSTSTTMKKSLPPRKIKKPNASAKSPIVSPVRPEPGTPSNRKLKKMRKEVKRLKELEYEERRDYVILREGSYFGLKLLPVSPDIPANTAVETSVEQDTNET
jgi:hypothetical protein